MRTGFGAAEQGNGCQHPMNMRSTLHGFGQKADEVREFFCRTCQTKVNLDELERQKEQQRALPDSES